MEKTGGYEAEAYTLRDRTQWSSGLFSPAEKAANVTSVPRQPGKSGANDPYYKGAVVRHAKFGLGTVQRSEGAGDDLKISVSFPGHGVKMLAVKYANLEVI